MSLASRARRIAVAAVYGGGSLGLAGGAAVGVLLAETKLARRWIGEPAAEPPAADGAYGHHPGPPIRLVMVGDSSAAGLGVHQSPDTPGAVIAAGVAALARRPVRLASVARSGAQSSDLDRQVGLALQTRPDVAVIMIGANDVTHRVRPSTSVRLLDQAVRRLLDAGVDVVVGTCPDLGTVEPIAQPLRFVARKWSRQLAAAQTIAVVEAGGRTVSLGDLLGPEFSAAPGEMFGPDRFHPSAAGYASLAAALLPSVCSALGLSSPTEEVPEPARGEGVLPIAEAAAEAATEAGTEVAATQVAGRDRGPRGRWALLRHRRRRPLPVVEPAEPADLDRAEPDRAPAPAGGEATR
jgi:lysophospholipase L1-like esterase